MTQAARLSLRMHKELKLLLSDPPPGASFPSLSAAGDADASASLAAIDAEIEGPEGTVYAGGIFKIRIQIPERYPFQPPTLTFATPIYHPNIDNGGRICLDILNLPPKGAWQPSLNISTVITSIGLLLSEPNPDDGLMYEASREFKYNRQAFDLKARTMTEKYAKTSSGIASSSQGTKPTELRLISDKEVRQESKSEGSSCITNASKSLGSCKKLSLDSLVPHCKKDGTGEPYKATDQISSTLHNKKMPDHEQRSHQLKRTNDVVTLGNGNFATGKRKLSLELLSELKQRDLDNVNSLVGQHVFNFPQGSDNISTSEEKVITTDESLKLNNGSKKLSLGFPSKSRNHERVENENLKPVKELTPESPHKSRKEFSVPSKKPEAAHQTSLGGGSLNTELNKKKCMADQVLAVEAVENLHDSGRNISASLLESQDPSVLCSASLAIQKSKQRAEAPPAPSTVVVLDSDESDQEETTECRRSRLSLLRKRASARECKSSSRLTSQMPA